ncbi:hypothetical protein H6G64_22315 [Calothrix sp. FACHB-156]|nr:hypothetical protein [Calothrix sp. FACHB-156]
MLIDFNLVKAILQAIDMTENKIFVGDFDFGSKYKSEHIQDHLKLISMGGLIILKPIKDSTNNTAYLIT